MKHWKVFLLAGVICLVSLAGCGGQAEEDICSWANVGAIAETEDSWLYFIGNQLSIWSKEDDGEPEPWCGKEQCMHTSETSCPAIMYHKFINTLAVDRDYAYIAGLEEGRLFLYRMGLKEKAVSLERWTPLEEASALYCSVESLEANGNWYYLLGTAGEDQNFTWTLGAVELKDGSQKTIYTAEAGESLENLKVYGGQIYVCSWMGEESRLICLDQDGKKEEILPEAVYSYAVKDGLLYYSGEKPGIWRKNLKTGEKECWISGEESWMGISWDGKYWYADNYNSVRLFPGDETDVEKLNLMNRRILVYDENGGKVDEIRADSIAGECLFGGPDALVITQGEGGMYYLLFDKSQIGQERDNSSQEKIRAQYRAMDYPYSGAGTG